MNIFRLLYIFLKLRNSGIFNSFINGFNPLIKTFYNKEDSSRRLKIVLEELGPVYIKSVSYTHLTLPTMDSV